METILLAIRTLFVAIVLAFAVIVAAIGLAQLDGWLRTRRPRIEVRPLPPTPTPKRVQMLYDREWRDELPRADRRTRVQR